ncbi:MAG: hypothetical protein IT366_13805 [Candidatus Hydrogenedentes bacterium]|nr:hypothetical protein [Candidatus Hydrogenedentota bacterium]
MDEKLARFLGLPTEAEKAVQRDQFETKLKELFQTTQPDTTGPELLRNFVESDWFVAIKADTPHDAALTKESLEIRNVPKGKYRLAIASQGQSSTKSKGGQGGCLLPVFRNAPDQASRQMDGRSLVRMLPGEISGLLLHLPDQPPKELGNGYFVDLLGLADALDLEEIILHPAADQIEKLKCATWLVASKESKLRIEIIDGRNVVPVYTHRDRIAYSSQEIRPICGDELFRYISECSDTDGIVINRQRVLKQTGDSLNAPMFSPGIACRLLAGTDMRPGAQPLPSRNLCEIELWLQLRGFPLDDAKYIDAPYPEGPLIRAKSPRPSTWRMQETLHENGLNDDDCTWSPVFVLPPLATLQKNMETRTEIAPGETRILCAGLLAKALYANLWDATEPTHAWQPGRNFLIGRYVPKWAREHSQYRLAIANELLKFLPPNADTIPRDAILTVEGAAILRNHPHAAQRAWIESTIRQAKRFTRPWVWWG